MARVNLLKGDWRGSDTRAFTANDPRIMPVTETGCWLWTLYVQPNGYPSTKVGGKTSLAHRAFFEKAKGVIPVNLVLDHLCRVRSCVNPDHLRAVTQRENIYAVGSLSPSKIHGEKPNCPRCGRAYTVGAGRIYRSCRPCYNYKRRIQRRDARLGAQREAGSIS